jgi:hypothetical protein
MLRLRSDDNQRHRDLRVTEQTTDVCTNVIGAER